MVSWDFSLLEPPEGPREREGGHDLAWPLGTPEARLPEPKGEGKPSFKGKENP